MNRNPGIAENYLDVSRIACNVDVDTVRFRDACPSTSDWARQEMETCDSDNGLLYLTADQTAGRGRGNKKWQAGHGCLTFTLALPTSAVETTHQSLIPLAAGCGICDALDSVGVDAQIKWPNDIVLHGKKLGGILVESLSSGPRVLVGCGLNVNNPILDLPDATSVFEATGQRRDLTEMTIAAVSAVLDRIAKDAMDPLIKDLNHRNGLRGRKVQWTQGGVSRFGVALGICEDGALQLITKEGKQKVYSGTIMPLPDQDSGG